MQGCSCWKLRGNAWHSLASTATRRKGPARYRRGSGRGTAGAAVSWGSPTSPWASLTCSDQKRYQRAKNKHRVLHSLPHVLPQGLYLAPHSSSNTRTETVLPIHVIFMYFPRCFKKNYTCYTCSKDKHLASADFPRWHCLSHQGKHIKGGQKKKKIFISFSNLAATLQIGDVCHIVKTAL